MARTRTIKGDDYSRYCCSSNYSRNSAPTRFSSRSVQTIEMFIKRFTKLMIILCLPDAHKWNVVDFVPATHHYLSTNAMRTAAYAAKTIGNVLDFVTYDIADLADKVEDQTDSKVKAAVGVSCEDSVTCPASPSDSVSPNAVDSISC